MASNNNNATNNSYSVQNSFMIKQNTTLFTVCIVILFIISAIILINTYVFSNEDYVSM